MNVRRVIPSRRCFFVANALVLAAELESPFGKSDNDLPLLAVGAEISASLDTIVRGVARELARGSHAEPAIDKRDAAIKGDAVAEANRYKAPMLPGLGRGVQLPSAASSASSSGGGHADTQGFRDGNCIA